MRDHSKGLLITLLGVLLVVPDSLFIRLIDAAPLVIAFWRLLLSGGLVLCAVLLTQGRAPLRALLGTGRTGLIYLIGAGLSGVLFVLAVSHTSVANVVVIIASLPVFAALFSRVFLGEPISRRMVLTMLGVAAGLVVIARGSGETEGASWVGDAIALCTSALFAGALTAARKLRAVSMVPAAALAYVLAALCLLPFIDPGAVPNGQWPLVALYGLFIAGSSAGLALGPRYITSAEVGLLILLETVLAPLLVWWLIGENPGQWALIGGAIVVGVLALSNLAVLRRRAKV